MIADKIFRVMKNEKIDLFTAYIRYKSIHRCDTDILQVISKMDENNMLCRGAFEVVHKCPDCKFSKICPESESK